MDKLKLYDDKIEFMIIGSRQQLEKVSVAELSVGDTSVAPDSTARNLGVLFDRNLKFDAQITKTCCAGYYYLYNIRKIRKYLTLDSTRCLVHTLVMGRVDYCNSLLYGLPRNNINKLQRLQNMAARLITNTPRFCHTTPVLCQLHWLPVGVRIKFKVIHITFKAIHGLVSYYVQSLMEVKEKSSYNLRSNGELLLAPPTFKSKKTLDDWAFQVAAPTLWNKLPSALRMETSLKRFKAKLKTLLFKEGMIYSFTTHE